MTSIQSRRHFQVNSDFCLLLNFICNRSSILVWVEIRTATYWNLINVSVHSSNDRSITGLVLYDFQNNTWLITLIKMPQGCTCTQCVCMRLLNWENIWKHTKILINKSCMGMWCFKVTNGFCSVFGNVWARACTFLLLKDSLVWFILIQKS